MSTKAAFVAHPKCRPPRDAEGVIDTLLVVGRAPLMLGIDGRWRLDDGSPAVAFIGSLPGGNGNYVWVAACQCHKGPAPMKCPRIKALTHAREKLDIESISIVERPRKGGTLR